jgi:hypothetical protein
MSGEGDENSAGSALEGLQRLLEAQQKQLAEEMKQQLQEALAKYANAKPAVEQKPARTPLSKHYLDVQHAFNCEMAMLVERVEQCVDNASAKCPEVDVEFVDAREAFTAFKQKLAKRQAELQTLEDGGGAVLENLEKAKKAKKNADALGVGVDLYMREMQRSAQSRDYGDSRPSQKRKLVQPFQQRGGLGAGGAVAHVNPGFYNSFSGFQQPSPPFSPAQHLLHPAFVPAQQPGIFAARPQQPPRARACFVCHDPRHLVAQCPHGGGGMRRGNSSQ